MEKRMQLLDLLDGRNSIGGSPRNSEIRGTGGRK
ncbi:hypothetical protein Godav_011437 [Gossypium davidsonii]|uniref:Uncharacterized protein n=2 Tax=Gossypium TaxID=3633 RepID=A0A7J8R9T9_GOSDV|nr:hypothetical protein [Gossypium davidsonii]MBA0645707.1 hypothetical protein [Gossypium klotzschianum]